MHRERQLYNVRDAFFRFCRHGLWVASHPKRTIAASLAAVAICSLGLLRLWLPKDSDFVKNNEWLWENYPPDVRYELTSGTSALELAKSPFLQVQLPHFGARK